MRKLILFIFAFLLLAISIIVIVSAGSVQLEITTYANHDVTVNILDPVREDPLLTTLEDSTGQDGIANFNFEATASKIDISVLVRKNGKLVVFKKFEGYTPSGTISLRVLKETTTTVNQTANNTNQTTSTAANNATNQTANATSVAPTTNTSSTEQNASANKTSESSMPKYFSDLPIMKIIMYTVGILAIVLIIVGLILFLVFRGKNKAPGDIKVKKYSELKEEIKEKSKTVDEKKIEELEEKIQGLQEEVTDIKNKKYKIKEVEERIKKDMAELERLKR